MTAIETLLAGLFDYAGLYPPASLDLRSAANIYLRYRRSKRSAALGRFILNLDRADEFRSIVGDSLADFSLSVIAAENTDWPSWPNTSVPAFTSKASRSNAASHQQLSASLNRFRKM